VATLVLHDRREPRQGQCHSPGYGRCHTSHLVDTKPLSPHPQGSPHSRAVIPHLVRCLTALARCAACCTSPPLRAAAKLIRHVIDSCVIQLPRSAPSTAAIQRPVAHIRRGEEGPCRLLTARLHRDCSALSVSRCPSARESSACTHGRPLWCPGRCTGRGWGGRGHPRVADAADGAVEDDKHHQIVRAVGVPVFGELAGGRR
jgi:hypothetical protein